ncbi:MAG: FAD binding domain-containing protein [Pseudomonadota bacterium]
MKAAPFEYARPATLAEACSLLAAHGAEAKLIAGGQSLVPMMAMRLARPAWLIDIGRLAELQRVSAPADSSAQGDGVFVVGAGVRQAVMEREPLARANLPLMAKALRWVGHAQTRNRGTIGGSIVHGDVSAEIALVACVLDALLELHDTSGVTEIPAREFFQAPMITAILPEQCLAEIRFPVWRAVGGGVRPGCAFDEVSVRHGDFALVSACAQLELDADGRCLRLELGLGGAASVPLALPELSAQLTGSRLDEQAITAAAAAAADLADPEGDLHASADYRRHLARILLGRVLRAARQDAMDGGKERTA